MSMSHDRDGAAGEVRVGGGGVSWGGGVASTVSLLSCELQRLGDVIYAPLQ